MLLTERHYINQGTETIINLCKLSKILYNRCNFLMRQSWIKKEKLPDINILVSTVSNESCYKNFDNTKTAKQTIRQVLTDWSNFRKALNTYYKDKKKFKVIPKPPKYKKKLSQVIYYNETIKRKPLKENHLISTNLLFDIKSEHCHDFKQVVITPKTFGFIIDVSYEEENKEKQKLDKNNYCSIDLGVNNLCAITSNQLVKPILINGCIVKSINQYYNKNKTKHNSKKRYFRLENYFHHVSKYIVNICVKNKISTIIIGKNDGWKQNMKKKRKLHSNDRQTFQFIPFRNLISKIQYKAELVGIAVEFTEESYTSKSSFIHRDPLPEYNKENEESVINSFSGYRLERGLYKIKGTQQVINSDINGSANIMRKVIQNEKILQELDRSVAATPVKVNPLKILCNNRVVD